MAGIIVPAYIVENQERERYVDEQIMLGLYWSSVAHDVDPRASVVFIREGADFPNIIPGRWHVRIQMEPPYANHYIPITTPEGGYREPDSAAIEELKARRTEGLTVDDLIEKRRARERAAERERELRREQARDEMAADIKTLRRLEGGRRRRKQ